MNQRLKTPKLLEENISEILAQAMKWDYIKLESFYTEEGKKMKRQPTQKKIFANYPFDRGSISRIYKELKRTNNFIKNCQMIWKDTTQKKYYKWLINI